MVHGFGKRGLSSSLAAVAMLVALMLSVSLPARAEGQDLAEHFRGKTVNFIVGSSPGGGYDVTARLVARFASKYLPGNPSFIVQNMPGGGQLRGLRATMRSSRFMTLLLPFSRQSEMTTPSQPFGSSAVLGSFRFLLPLLLEGGEDPWLCGTAFRRLCPFVGNPVSTGRFPRAHHPLGWLFAVGYLGCWQVFRSRRNRGPWT